MNFDEAINEAARSAVELKVYLREFGGDVAFITPGTTGEVGGDHHAKVGVHLVMDNEDYQVARPRLEHLVKPLADRGVEIVFFTK